ncbi:G-protein alpha subunit-domain-containing protein [Mycena alexandri]|uniref:G-protein alpha subunit-domain-containing protein n=1 Tax=Mycena alexandri TaxID=1745969 RepID=A0AAD6WZ40_9AGAR|nr:G-protein alpha subunit-domain-containing protein [Mycena alexandri]
MPRPPSVRSIHSWWSDLHAATKPLIGVLYYLQARSFIGENTGRPLSTATIDTFLSYLAYKYSSLATKRMVLRHLSERAVSEEEAWGLVESNLFQSDVLDELMDSPDENMRQIAQWFITRLTSHEPLRLQILIMYPKRCRNIVKILLLGLRGSGKSTILNQMKLLTKGFDEHERAKYRMSIYKNVLDCAGMLARAVRRVGLGALPEDMQVHAMVLLVAFPAPDGDDEKSNSETETESVESASEISVLHSGEAAIGPFTRRRNHESGEYHLGISTAADVLPQTHAMLTPTLADAIWHISRVPAVGRVVDEHPADFYLMDSVEYFFSSIHRIAHPAYVPNEQDILHARVESTTMTHTSIPLGDLSIYVFDVGVEREKWIHHFEGITSIIFCAALSDYDQVSAEDSRVNRMRESLGLFDSIVNSPWFWRTSVILLLNKIDVFRKKLSRIPLERYFPEYTGGSDLNRAAKFILWRFLQENRARLSVYPHLTQATNDTKSLRLIFAAVKETILQNALKDSRIL